MASSSAFFFHDAILYLIISLFLNPKCSFPFLPPIHPTPFTYHLQSIPPMFLFRKEPAFHGSQQDMECEVAVKLSTPPYRKAGQDHSV